jgi:hypothetical protein
MLYVYIPIGENCRYYSPNFPSLVPDSRTTPLQHHHHHVSSSPNLLPPVRSQPVALQMTSRPVCRKRKQTRASVRPEQPPSPARSQPVVLQMNIIPSAQRVSRTQMIRTTSPRTRLPRARERPPSGLALRLTTLLLSRETRSLRRKAEIFHGFKVTKPPIILRPSA